MSLLNTLFGSSEHQELPKSEPTLELPEEEYSLAYPAAVRQSQLKTFQKLIEEERDTPMSEGPGADRIQESLNEAFRNSSLDSLEEETERIRSEAEAIVTGWLELIVDETDVIFFRIGDTYRLKRPLYISESRAEQEEDPFTLPSEFFESVSLVNELKQVEKTRDPVFVHRSQITPMKST